MNNGIGQTQPTAQQIVEWFKSNFGDEFTPNEKQEEWVKKQWGKPVTKEQWDETGLPKPTIDKERFERYKKGEAMFISGAELEYIEEHLGKPREFKPDEEKQLAEALQTVMEYEDKLRAEFDKDIATVIDLPPIEWLIEVLLPRKSLYFVSGLPGVGKTSLVLQMAACLRTGENFLGYPTHRANVLFIENNESQELVRDKVQKQSSVYPDLWDLQIYWGNIKLDNEPKKLRRLVQYKKPDVLIIDTYSDLHSKNENVASEMSPILDELRNVADDFGTTIVYLHHSPRSALGKPKRVSLRGSNTLEGECDFAICLVQRGNEWFLERIKFRGSFKPIKLKFDKRTITFKASGKITQGTKIAQRHERARQLVEEGKSKKEVALTLENEFAISQKQGRRDYDAILGELGQN